MFSKRSGDPDEPSYLEPYARVARTLGSDFRTLLWRNEQGQRCRFEVLAQMLEPHKLRVADLGSGRVDLLVFLIETDRAPLAYFGIDGVPAMAEAGARIIRERTLTNAESRLGDFVADQGLFDRLVAEDRADAFVFSGSLNTLEQQGAERVLERAFGALPAGGCLAFNFLSDLAPGGAAGETGPARRFSTLSLLSWALKRTPLVRFRHDYLAGHDATIAMRKV